MQIDLKNLFGNTEALEDKFVVTILKAFKANSSDAFDYLKFKQSLIALEALNLEESLRYKSAFATAQTMGVNKDKLTKSINDYLSVLDKEQSEFSTALKKQIDSKVKGSQDRIKKYQVEAEGINKKIEKLKKDQQEYLSAVETLQAQIDKTTKKIENTRNQFVETYDYFKRVIEEDRDNISTEL